MARQLKPQTAFAKRLIDARGSVDRDEFADLLGVAKSTLASWEQGVKMPPLDKIRAIRQQTGVSLDWLIAGEGEMRPSQELALPPPEPAPVALATIDGELLGKIDDAVTRAYKEMGVPIQSVARGQVVARIYNDLADAAADRAEWEGGLKVSIKHLQRELQAPVGEAGTSKRSA